ncbi:MAG: hypothetical protein EPO47_05030 [Rugosibacter sp.]|nr:MAG: hypothetical protein EPO47_05030 [Rugosibacter sp.]
MAEQDTQSNDGKGKRGAVHRSPAYPSIDLKSAIERARQFYGAEKRAAANVKVAAEHWGYSYASSGGKQAIAALLAFGLMEDEGSGDQRKVKLTDLALRIILDERQDSKERDEAIKRAALLPKIHQEILTKWPTLPSDANLRHYLVLDRKFNENVVSDFIREIRNTVSFAKLQESDSMSPTDERKQETPADTKTKVEIGDLIQWESNGVLQLATPTRVRQIQEHDGESWIFIEGNQTGIPMNEVSVIEKWVPASHSKAPPILPLVEMPTIGLDKQEREWLRGPLSKETNYRLIIAGDIGPKEIGKLIKLLEAQKSVLSDEDDDLA